MTVIDDHMARFGPAQRDALLATVATIRRELPDAAEVISYGMPTFKLDGRAVIGLNGFTRHNSLFPYSGEVFDELEAELSGYERTKGSVHFPIDAPFPASLLTRILRLRVKQVRADTSRRRAR